jgi:SAM-dependent methyltransferase
MRRTALQYLVCPECRAALSLASVTSEAVDGHVLEGDLVCAARGCRFLVKGGVPVLIPGNVNAVHTETAARFAEEWTRWRELRSYYERQFLGWISPVKREDFAGQLVFEAGCGKGRHTDLAARFGAKDVVAVDLGQSVYVAFENTRALPNAHVVLADLTHPPVRPVFDLVFSVGVLHHVPDPSAAAASVTSVARDGGRFVYWVYGRENNEWITRFVDPFRKAVTSKLPYRALWTLSTVPSAVIFAAIRLFYRPSGSGGVRPSGLPYGEYFSSMHDFPFDELHHIVFDQLVTPVAHYLPRSEVETWFAGGGARDVHVRWHNQNSWTVTGTVARGAAPEARAGEAPLTQRLPVM